MKKVNKHVLKKEFLELPLVLPFSGQPTLTSLFSTVCAGLSYEMFYSDKGIMIKLSRYDEKLPMLLYIITQDLKTISSVVNSSVFETYRKQLKKDYFNNLMQSKFLSDDTLTYMLEEHHKFLYDRYHDADDVTFGEFTETFAVALVKNVLHNMNCAGIEEKITSRIHKLPHGSNVAFLTSMMPSDINSTTIFN